MKVKYLVVGCFSLIALFSIFIIAGYYFLNQTSIELVEKYSSPVPLDFQSTSTDKAAAQETLERFKHFITVLIYERLQLPYQCSKCTCMERYRVYFVPHT